MNPLTIDPLSTGDVAQHLGVSRWTAARQLAAAGIDMSGGISRRDYAAWIHQQARPLEDNTMTDKALPEMHRFEDVAVAYGISVRVLKGMARGRRCTYTRIGRGFYFTGPQLAAFLAGREVKSEDDAALNRMRQRRDRRGPRKATKTTKEAA